MPAQAGISRGETDFREGGNDEKVCVGITKKLNKFL